MLAPFFIGPYTPYTSMYLLTLTSKKFYFNKLILINVWPDPKGALNEQNFRTAFLIIQKD